MFAARLRYRFLLNQKEEDIYEALKIYYDVGNIEGVISCLVAKAIIKSLQTQKKISS